jgi:hypothetical protein
MLGKFINHCEDSLTAAVFTHLLHLPTEVFWRILRNACYTDRLPEYPGEPLSVEFWPNWDPKGTDNTNRVIPDLFIRFANFHLIIEGTRWDQFQQSSGQWQKEVTAYANQYAAEAVPVGMIALGGIWDTKDDEVILTAITCPVHMCKWERVLEECHQMKKELERLKYPSSHTHACVRTLTDMINLFGWHGYSTGLWFADFNFESNLLSPSIDSYRQCFRKTSLQFQSS